jgi:hypothetical protein
LFAEERDRQDQRAKACRRKQRSYNARGDYVSNNTDNEDFDEVEDDTYPTGTILHAPNSAIGRSLLARIKQAQEPLPPRKLTAPVSHPLPSRPLLERLAPAPGPHASTRGVVPRLSHLDRVD